MRAVSASIRRTALQRAYRKRVPQIVQTWAALRRRYYTCPADQPVKGLFDRNVAQRWTTRVDEHRINLGTRPATRQVALQARYCRVVQRHQAGFPELGLADQ